MRLLGNVKKGQAAMEFLMTYGWAILVVLVVIGALAYFGVLSPQTLLPEKCNFPVSLTCIDHQVGSASLTLILQNGAGRDMTVTRVSAASEALGTGINLGCGCGTGGITTLIRNGATATFPLNVPDTGCVNWCNYRDTGRDKNKYNITVAYYWQDSPTLSHELSGDLLAKKT